MLGMLASSKAGHDQNKIYIVIGVTETAVLLSDGRVRPICRPKKKNRKHIQVIRRFEDGGLTERIQAGAGYNDDEIRSVISFYEQQHMNGMRVNAGGK